MIATLNARLRRLEATQAPPTVIETSFTPALRLLRLLLAAHLGALQPGQDVTSGEARALGYDNSAEMRSAMVAEVTAFSGWGSAHNVAMVQMLAKHGGGSTSGMAADRDAIQALLTGLPEAFADHPDADPARLDAATEWVSL